MTTTLALRTAVSADREFLRQVYASTRAEELSLAGWDEVTGAAFVAMQFDAQDRGYRWLYPDAEQSVIELVEGRHAAAVGRLWVDRRAAAIHVLDIALLPAYRGRGLGTECLRRLMAEAGDRQRPLTLCVERSNPARRLYERLGFVPVDGQGLHQAMAWRAATVSLQETEDEQA